MKRYRMRESDKKFWKDQLIGGLGFAGAVLLLGLLNGLIESM